MGGLYADGSSVGLGARDSSSSADGLVREERVGAGPTGSRSVNAPASVASAAQALRSHSAQVSVNIMKGRAAWIPMYEADSVFEHTQFVGASDALAPPFIMLMTPIFALSANLQAAQHIRALNDQVAASAAALNASQADAQEARAASEQLANDKQTLQAKVSVSEIEM